MTVDKLFGGEGFSNSSQVQPTAALPTNTQMPVLYKTSTIQNKK